MERSEGYVGDPSVCALVIMRSPNVFLKLTQTPVMPKRELLSSIRYTERDSAPFSLDTALADCWIMDGVNGSSKMDSLIAVMPEESVKERLASAVPGFAGPASVTVVPTALMALVANADGLRSKAPSLFIHICDEGFGAYAFSGGKLVFMRETPMARTEDERWFHKTASEEIARSADFLARTSGIEFAAVWLLGPNAPDGLTGLLSSALGMDVKVYDPSRDFSITFTGSRVFPGGSLAVMLGAALGGRETIRITPRKADTLGFLKKPAPAAALITAVALLCALLASSFALKRMDARIAGLEAEIGSLRTSASDFEKAATALANVEADNSALKSRIETFQKVIAGPRPGLRGALTLLSANSPENVALTRFQVNIGAMEHKDGAPPPASPTSRRNTRIEGLSRGTEAEMTAGVSALLSTLAGSPLFSSVTLSRLRKEPQGSAIGGMTSFEIVADFIVPGRNG
jgi:Tfp pilus assembly protein PilN